MTLMPPASVVREHLDRIERSASFAKAERLRAFLRFVVEKTLAGEQDSIKEYSIALDVCGRDPSFDPRALTEELIHQLSRLPGLRVIARTSAFQYRDQAVHVRQIAEHLCVGSVVEESVRWAGEHIRHRSADRRGHQRKAEEGHVPALNLAIALLGLGRHDEAVALLERAHAERAVPLYQLAVDPVYDPVRKSPRVQAVLRDMGLGSEATSGS